MFDSISVNNARTSVNFNSVSGTLVKSSEMSKFVRFHKNSNLAKLFFDVEKPRRSQSSYNAEEVIVLQVMLCADNEFLVEYLDKGNE